MVQADQLEALVVVGEHRHAGALGAAVEQHQIVEDLQPPGRAVEVPGQRRRCPCRGLAGEPFALALRFRVVAAQAVLQEQAFHGLETVQHGGHGVIVVVVFVGQPPDVHADAFQQRVGALPVLVLVAVHRPRRHDQGAAGGHPVEQRLDAVAAQIAPVFVQDQGGVRGRQGEQGAGAEHPAAGPLPAIQQGARGQERVPGGGVGPCRGHVAHRLGGPVITGHQAGHQHHEQDQPALHDGALPARGGRSSPQRSRSVRTRSRSLGRCAQAVRVQASIKSASQATTGASPSSRR